LNFPGRSRENTITTSFENIGLSAESLRAIAEQGNTDPDGKPGGKRSVRLTGLPRDED